MLEMDFIPEDELEIESVLLRPGPANFLIRGFKDKNEKGFDLVNKNGKKMVNLQFIVIDQDKTRGLVHDFITTSSQWKIKAIADSVGAPEIYSKNAAGKLEFDPLKLIGMGGECSIKTYSAPDKEDKTVIEKYKKSLGNHSRKFQEEEKDEDDDVPF